YGDALHGRDLVEIEIVGDDLGLEAQGQFDQFVIHLAGLARNVLDDANLVRRQFLNALQDFETASAALTAQAVGRVGDGLELMQDKAWNKERAIEKVRFANFGDASVNEHAGVQQFAVGGNRGRICAVTEQCS